MRTHVTSYHHIMPTLAILLITMLLGQPASPPEAPGAPAGQNGQGNRGKRNATPISERFDQLDRNKDGVLTPDEFQRKALFNRADADKDGKITREEAAALAGNARRQAGRNNQRRPNQSGQPEQKTNSGSALQITRDIPYVSRPSDPERQSLDIYAHATDTPKPVMIWIHGGGWAAGNKTNGAEAKAKLLAAQGVMLVSINYRLSPAVTHPSHIKDVAAAVAWVHDNIDDYGGDPERIVIMGHSAGAHLAALVATDSRRLAFHRKSLGIIDAVILLDGAAYDLPAMLEGPNVADRTRRMHERWATTNPRMQADASPIRKIKSNTDIPPFLILHIDRPSGTAQSQALAQALDEAGAPSVVMLCKDDTHSTINTNLGTPGHRPTEAIQIVLEGLGGQPASTPRGP